MQLQDRSPRWIFWVLGIFAVVVANVGISRLNTYFDRATDREKQLYQLQAAANRLDALEWRAISQQKVEPNLASEIAQQREQTMLIFNALENTAASQEESQKVKVAYENYASAVNKLFYLLKINQLEKALEVDEAEVDPGYHRLYEVIKEQTLFASENAKKLGRWTRFGILVITLSLVTTIALLFRYNAKEQIARMNFENMRRREADLEQERKILESKVLERTQELQEANTKLTEALIYLKQSQVKLIQSEKMSALGNLVAGVAHEINNPIGCIVGNVSATQDYFNDLLGLLDLYGDKFPEPGAEIEEELETIDLDYVREDLPKLIRVMKDGADRIKSISKSLRTFSRDDSDTPQKFNLHEGIDSSILILRHRLKANDNRPAIEVVPDYGNLPEVSCFPGQINQAFMNILANAIDAVEEANAGRSFTEIQANPNRIVIRTRVEDEGVKIAIADNGAGMSPEVKARIFDHLFTTKGVGKGTGLGLAIARQIIVEKHGGAIAVNSEPSKGTEFVLTLPLH